VSETLPERVAERRIGVWISLAGGGVLGTVLLIAAWAKALDPGAFAEQIESLGLAFVLDARRLAWLGVAVEAALGLALVLGLRSRPLLVFTTLLVALFLFLTGRIYLRELRGLPIDEAACGCFGNLVERTPAQAFWQDLILLVPALAATWLAAGRRTAAAGLRWAAVAVLGVGAFAFAARSLALPLDDLATRARPGVAVDDLCAGRDEKRVCLGQLLPALHQGETWVVLGDFQSEEFATRDTPALNAWLEGQGAASSAGSASAPATPALLVVVTATLDEQNQFFWKAAPAFELHDAPAALLRPLYRTRPRSLLVDRGIIRRTVRGLPPARPEP
jgi:uncharacterized membrane protein YphA (DoxX/SURF4 family)